MITVDLTQFFPFTFLLHLARALVSFNIINTILKSKYNIFATFAGVVGIGMIYSYFTLKITNITSAVEIIILVLYYILQFVILLVLTNGRIYLKVAATVFSFLSFLAGSALFSFLSALFAEGATEKAVSREIDLTYFLADSLFVYIFSFVFAAIITAFRKHQNKTYKYKTKRIFFFLFPITHIFCIEAVLYAQKLLCDADLLNDAKTLEIVSCVFFLICFIIDFSIMFIVDRVEKFEQDEEEYKEKLTKSQLKYDQFLLLKNEREEFRKIRHDMANILTTTTGFIEIGKYDKALNILKNTSDDLFNSALVPISNNETINTIYAIKTKEANQNGAKLNIKVQQTCDIFVADYDICRILNNIIDNAINAVKDEDINKDINISINIDENKIVITSKNEYKETKRAKKKDSKLHGYGQAIVKEITKKYNGSFEADKQCGIYITNLVLDNCTPPPEKLTKLRHFNVFEDIRLSEN